MREAIEVGYQTFVSDGDVAFGAVRQVAPEGRPELVIYVENAGDFVVPGADDTCHAKRGELAEPEREPLVAHTR